MKKKYRIKRDYDFTMVFKRGKSFANRQFVVYFKDNPDTGHLRLGISVSKKLGNAVKRNKIKRRIRAFFQKYQDDLKPREYIVIARHPVSDMDYHEIEKSLIHVLKIAKCMNNRR
ncbi:MAG TPA: ribonuclease P protein component [Aliicoccus persicus]|uniref:Ribonuclease P protein component n=1 Tax=Aliicoccus persicus TaxID=930138 RepID=A0A921DVZ4_9STAP|nr:ribonuclease P protein component [Aliicoccus persicus]